MVSVERIGPQSPTGYLSGRNNGAANFAIDAIQTRVRPVEMPCFKPDICGLTHHIWRTQQMVGAGLQNLGNTCYLNSMLQCIAHCPAIGNLLANAGGLHGFSCPFRSSGNPATSSPCSACMLQRQLYAQLRNSSSSSLRPSEILAHIKLFSKSFIRGQQEDSHEFFVALLDTLERDLRAGYAALHGLSKAPTGALTTVEQLFQGRTLSQVTCLSCGHASRTYETFSSLSLEVSYGLGSVQEALQHFTQAEMLEGANKYKCDCCKRLVNARKQMAIDDEPNVLCIHLKRFDATGTGTKISRHVRFDGSLDLSPFSSMSLLGGGSGGSGGAGHGRAGLYKLHGVLVHQGASIHSGHYLAFVRDSSEGWYCANDCSVTPCSTQNVARQQAYMLFYGRTSVKAPAPPPAPQPAPAGTRSAKFVSAGHSVPSPRVFGPQPPPSMAAARSIGFRTEQALATTASGASSAAARAPVYSGSSSSSSSSFSAARTSFLAQSSAAVPSSSTVVAAGGKAPITFVLKPRTVSSATLVGNRHASSASTSHSQQQQPQRPSAEAAPGRMQPGSSNASRGGRADTGTPRLLTSPAGTKRSASQNATPDDDGEAAAKRLCSQQQGAAAEDAGVEQQQQQPWLEAAVQAIKHSLLSAAARGGGLPGFRDMLRQKIVQARDSGVPFESLVPSTEPPDQLRTDVRKQFIQLPGVGPAVQAAAAQLLEIHTRHSGSAPWC